MKRTALKRKTPLRPKKHWDKSEAARHRHVFAIESLLKKRTLRKGQKRKPATLAEKGHLTRACSLGCIIPGCRNAPNVHHIREGYGIAERASHWETIPLCRFHHQDGPMGAAFHAGTRSWQAKHGTEVALLVQVYERLGIDIHRLPELRGEAPPWWPRFLDGTALVAKAAVIFKEEGECQPASE